MAFHIYVLAETVLDLIKHVLYIGVYYEIFIILNFFFGGEYSFERKPFANQLAAFFSP